MYPNCIVVKKLWECVSRWTDQELTFGMVIVQIPQPLTGTSEKVWLLCTGELTNIQTTVGLKKVVPY